ncbi:MAG: hypothetical protein JWN28_112 [Candidatus Saccharibacteria bacterium]|nr:hypothetical protein [Candidatus Saccharibacteria bacterium]
MRTKNSLINIVVSIILGFIATIVSFIAQKFLVDTLGLEYLGLNALFMNIITMLSVVELGLGAAVVYHLYGPIKERNTNKISSLMLFYKKGYRVVAFVVFLLGLAVFPFLPIIVGENSIHANIPVVYFLFIISVTVSYLLTYKRSILYADQKNYIVSAVHLGAIVVLNGLQIGVLVATQNYYLFLALKIIITILENIVISAIVDRRYKISSNAARLDAVTKADIFTKIKGLLHHKIGDFLVLGSTNIIISVFLGIKAVGLYSNYLLIQTALSLLFSQLSTALTASIGNLLLEDSKKEHYLVFLKLQFAMHSLAVICVSVFFTASASFITLWIGADYLFSVGVLAALTLNIYLILIRSTFNNFKSAAGIFYEDRFVPLFESVINIVASILLVHFMGIAGAFLGTALSSLALHAYSYPKYVYKGVFGRTYREYVGHVIQNFMIALGGVVAAYFASTLVNVESILLQLISDITIAIIVPSLILWIIYRKSDEYRYFNYLLSKIIKTILRKLRIK